jgi:hypothetical protein
MDRMPDWLGPAATLASTFFAAVAAGAGVVAVIIARRTLREAHSTTQLQAKNVEATNAIADKTQATSRVLDHILVEAQVTRELDQLHRIANQVEDVIVWRKRSTNRDPAFLQRTPLPHTQLMNARTLLAAYVAAFPVGELPKCRVLADQGAGRDADPQLEVDAQQELKAAFSAASARLRAQAELPASD